MNITENVIRLTADGLIHKLLERTSGRNPLEKKPPHEGSYAFIPLMYSYFIKLLTIVKPLLNLNINKMPTFVDYGAGVGWTLYVANQFGFKAEGYEIQKELIEYFYYPLSSKLVYGDLRTDEPFKENYDVVYFYSPFSDSKSEIEFEIKALKTVKVGGYVICPVPAQILRVSSFKYDRDNKKLKNQLIKLKKNFEQVKIEKEYYPIYKRLK